MMGALWTRLLEEATLQPELWSGFVQVSCQDFLVREACVRVLVGGAVFLLSGVQ